MVSVKWNWFRLAVIALGSVTLVTLLGAYALACSYVYLVPTLPSHGFARARGRTTRAIHFGRALRNTLVPVITVAGLQFGSVIAFAIITETVFQWPGMGLLFVQAVQNVDIPIMAAYLLMASLIFVTINLVVDILYTIVDPRLRSTISRPA